jgi:hypothetical protein
MTHIVRKFCAREKRARFTPDVRVASANTTQMLRALAARGARNKGFDFWLLYLHTIIYTNILH